MRWATGQAGFLATLALLGVVAFSGCDRPSSDRRELRDRYLRRALAAKENQDIDRAITWCEEALDRRPGLALAHRELALMLDHYRQDYVGALYHYQRYLQLRPGTAERADIEEMMRHCRTAFAAQMEESSVELKRAVQERDARIRRLELEVANLRAQTGGATLQPAVAPVVPPAAPAASPAAAPAQVHVVLAGDTLGTISARYYGTPAKWKTIFNANRDRVPDANNLRVGTRLDIPPP
jgi:LysM repeat protein